MLFLCTDCTCSFLNANTLTRNIHEEFLPVPACVCRLCFGRPQSDRDSLLIPIFQLEVSGAWLAAAGAQLQRKDREEGKTNRKEGRDGRGEICFYFLGCLVT